MKQLLYCLLSVMLFNIPAPAETNQGKGQANHDNQTDLSSVISLNHGEMIIGDFGQELGDEIYPEPYLHWQTTSHLTNWLGENYFDTKEWEDIENDTFDDWLDAFRHLAEGRVKDSSGWQSFTEKLENWFTLRVTPYFDRPKGPGTQKQLTVDAEIPIRENDQGLFPEVNLGTRFRHLDNPGFYLGFQLLGNGNGQRLRHELIFYPAREEFRWLVKDMPRGTDFRITWDYQKEEIDFRFLKNPFKHWFDSSEYTGVNFSVGWDYGEGGALAKLGFYTRF